MPVFNHYHLGVTWGGEFWLKPTVYGFKGDVFNTYVIGWLYFGLELQIWKKTMWQDGQPGD